MKRISLTCFMSTHSRSSLAAFPQRIGGTHARSHQEMERIVNEMDEILKFQPDTTAWLPVEQIGSMLTHELGYEDKDEFEDALKGTFEEFCRTLPHLEVREKDGGESRCEMRLRVDDREERPMRMVCRVESRSDLYRVCFKAPDAKVEIPELEFEIGADQKNRIDTIYNHIGAAILNLGRYVAQASEAELNDDNRNKIVDTITLLNILLDVEKPWTFIVHDPKGKSEFKPTEGVEVTYFDMPAIAE